MPVTPSASPTPDATASPSPTASPTPGAATPRATPTDGASASPTPGGVVTPEAGQTPKTQRSTPPTATDKKKAQVEAAAKKAAAKKKVTALATCPTGDLRPTLTGARTVKATKATTFSLSLINGSSKACYLKMTSANFTLTLVSGKDRIWSTDDCPAAVPAQSRKLASQKSVDWKIRWNGQRSGSGCSKERKKPGPGYYWAIANYDDAKEVRWRLILT